MVVGRSGRASFVASALLGLGGLGACILADPPAELPTISIVPPEILQDSVLPSSPLLTTLPGQFMVPVVFDPREETKLVWDLFVDQVEVFNQKQAPIGADGGVMIPIDDPSDVFAEGDECHTFVVLVFYSDAIGSGSDSATWFYSPTGTFDGCPVFDGGAEGGAD